MQATLPNIQLTIVDPYNKGVMDKLSKYSSSVKGYNTFLYYDRIRKTVDKDDYYKQQQTNPYFSETLFLEEKETIIGMSFLYGDRLTNSCELEVQIPDQNRGNGYEGILIQGTEGFVFDHLNMDQIILKPATNQKELAIIALYNDYTEVSNNESIEYMKTNPRIDWIGRTL